ncbi:hypothetical protein L2E82_16314 [Cichorium intybus]|uniref:Uncharacterized protein n=1 Tax=Cichorium intybus TaxID=13427 RepID=A0ACB9F5T2_CICIN|nr:hypothetical protein L2E82_16314 [Cichorium intybus]
MKKVVTDVSPNQPRWTCRKKDIHPEFYDDAKVYCSGNHVVDMSSNEYNWKGYKRLFEKVRELYRSSIKPRATRYSRSTEGVEKVFDEMSKNSSELYKEQSVTSMMYMARSRISAAAYNIL